MESSVEQQLKDLEFSDEQIRLGLKYSDDKTLEGVVAWLSENPDFKEPMETEAEPAKTEGNGNPPALEGEPISSLVNQALAKELEVMGYSKEVREKALFLTQNASIEAALEWIDEHKDDPDFNEELRMVKQEEGPKLTPEEAFLKAKQLQQKIREARAKKEAEDELERERSRIQSGKALAEAKRAIDEQQKKMAAEQARKEKEEFERERLRMLEQLERDKAERLGKTYVAKPKVEEPPESKVKKALQQMRIVYPTHSYPDTMKVCLQTIKKVLENVLKQPDELKFQKINLSNAAFKQRVGDVVGGVFILNAIGFEEKDGQLVLGTLKPDVFTSTISLLDSEINKL